VNMYDLPKKKFPFVVRLYRDKNEEPTWECEVSGAGAITVPALGNITFCKIEYADGTTEELDCDAKKD